MSSRLSTPESNAVARICSEWYVAFGMVTLVVVVSLWVSPLWMPLCELILAVALALFGPGRKMSANRPCGRLTTVTVYSLLLTGVVSFAITVAYRTEFVHRFFDITTLNHSIPYITSLIIFPILSVLAFFNILPAVAARHARKCHLRHEYNPGNAMFGRVVHATYRSMMLRLAFLCALISTIDWVYYSFFYHNVSINTPDRFFFLVVPAALYAWSIVNIRREYSVLALHTGRKVYADSGTPLADAGTLRDSVVLRFFVVRNNRLLVDLTEQTVLACSVDTPMIEVKSADFTVDDDSARKLFEHRTGIGDCFVRVLYSTSDPLNHNKIYHILVNIGENANTDLLHGEWVDVGTLDNLMKMGSVTPAFAHEIFRIHTITMAWKTYHSDGRRRYPIRNYRPTFRLSDLQQYDELDYGNDHWLRVSRINQDKNLWWLRKHFMKNM